VERKLLDNLRREQHAPSNPCANDAFLDVTLAHGELGASQLARAWLVRPQLGAHKRHLKHINGTKSLALTCSHAALASQNGAS
jgi:hypothetical protein